MLASNIFITGVATVGFSAPGASNHNGRP